MIFDWTIKHYNYILDHGSIKNHQGNAIAIAQVVEHFLDRFFDKDGHPNLFRLNLPTHDGPPVEVDVPLITLTHGNHLNIKELEIEFEVELGHLEDVDDDDISAAVTSVNGKRMAKVKMKLDSDAPPEGIARIRQEMIKQLPS